MFTGLVEEIGVIVAAGRSGDGFDLTVNAEDVVTGIALGDSISVNGVCLTVTNFDDQTFTVGLAPETLNRTNLGALTASTRVNLERAALPTTRLGGHYVQGHVDGTAQIQSITKDNDALWFKFTIKSALMRYIVSKGYITIDGASLTVVDTGTDWFNITLIAYSQAKLTLASKKPGDKVNIEVDILAKYVERLISPHSSPSDSPRLTTEKLAQAGFATIPSKHGAS